MKRTPLALGLLTAIAFAGASAHAGVLYDSTGSPRYANPLDTAPLSFNVGFDTDILWDDAPIATNSLANPFVDVTKLTFMLLRTANAPAVDIDIYWANMVPDAGINRGTNADPFRDSPVDDPGTANFVQRISLGANGANAILQPISFGNGVDTLFTTGVLDESTADAEYIDGVNYNYPVGTHPGFGYFMVGLKMSTTDPENLWVIASNPNNLHWVVDDLQDDVPSTIGEFDYGVDDLAVPVAGTMSMTVEGNLVPEPASLATLGISALAFLARRRRVA